MRPGASQLATISVKYPFAFSSGHGFSGAASGIGISMAPANGNWPAASRTVWTRASRVSACGSFQEA
ncbi:MAG: hypothetical protein NTU94_07310 [Planctomycetota bacterium]|nr:hypothetical protein [Planctomycetota bacterium]